MPGMASQLLMKYLFETVKYNISYVVCGQLMYDYNSTISMDNCRGQLKKCTFGSIEKCIILYFKIVSRVC